MESIPSSLEQAFDPEQFRKLGHDVVDRLADHLTHWLDRKPDEAIPWESPASSLERWSDLAPIEMQTLFESVIDHSVKLHHPRFMGHQISPSLPIAAVAGLVTDLLNNGMGVYEMGIAGTAIENTVVKATAAKLGFNEGADGFLTSGGSLANLTALVAAFEQLPTTTAASQVAILVSEQAHYCVTRSAHLLGVEPGGIIRVATNDRYQMDLGAMRDACSRAEDAGRKIMAVVGSACSTSTGSFDDLTGIGEFCRAKGFWFHVDGAHGAAMAFSEKYRYKVAGIELADSVAMDFHKMLLTPAIISALIFRDEQKSYQSFRQKADYLWSQSSEDHEWFNLAKRTFECTKSMMGLKVYSIIRAHGFEVFDESVTRVVDLAQAFGTLIEERQDFALAVSPETNIVCFRYAPEDQQALSRINQEIRQQLLEEGRHYIVQTTLEGETWLRTTLANPMTELRDLNDLLERIEQIGQAKCS